ncbi:hypothetical protein HYFRA_00012150 [Hymenoscyphus fraxineus]|uniref:Fungal calcium binding protein domain-containing protein n=1 Tax=Hymenoscyphus fraxineus TaxID=746836 RepID=A0A9N9L308_9HELO|nr:hypothetical protein HYFRA_00012150 [Hymenoscyphus fraxineus]
MRLTNNHFLFLVAIVGANAENKCPTTDYACLDVINSSLCISQNAVNAQTDATAKDTLIKCVEYAQSASNLTGSAKYCRCTGCHSAPINAALEALFPQPCSSY